MAELNSFPWIELAALAPGQSHYWSFDPSWVAHGWVFQATAYPEPPDARPEPGSSPSRVEVTEVFVQRPTGGFQAAEDCRSRINITVTNCGDRWAAYSLWVVSLPPHSTVAPRPAATPSEPESSPAGPLKLLVVHDEYGKIKSAGAAPSRLNLRAGLRPQRGELVTEVHDPAIGPGELLRNPGAISEHFRVDAASATLVAKER
jgi:hypothetical protein